MAKETIIFRGGRKSPIKIYTDPQTGKRIQINIEDKEGRKLL